MSSQQGPKAAPGQHSAHILLGFILREPQSTSANFLGDVGMGTVEDRAIHAGGCPGLVFRFISCSKQLCRTMSVSLGANLSRRVIC